MELIVVCVILGVLLRLGSVMYSTTHEKARAAEARSMLGYIRTAEENYWLDNDWYSGNLTLLGVEDVQDSCSKGTQYFSYTLGGITNTTFTANATRCTSGGKSPPGKTAYTLSLDQGGNLTIPDGY
ncbi:MAG: hypothetical protein NTU54_04795 [Candidatus Omnitrophica bacterium]|nr:hypothetical protein [Candidatus Omnitrophota bacterium]